MESDHKEIMNILTDIKIDTAVLVEKVSKLEETDAGTRLTKLETRSKTITWGSAVALPLLLGKDYLMKLFL